MPMPVSTGVSNRALVSASASSTSSHITPALLVLRINGVPSCANELMLGKILREKWGFQGMVTSDSGAVADISENHHYTPDLVSKAWPGSLHSEIALCFSF